MGLENTVQEVEREFGKIEGEVLDYVDPSLVKLCGVDDALSLGYYSRDGKLLGFIAYDLSNLLYGREKSLELLLAISNIKRRGIFKELFSYLKEIAIDNECENISLNVFEWNKTAIKVYHKLGFKPYKKVFSEEAGNNILNMKLKL